VNNGDLIQEMNARREAWREMQAKVVKSMKAHISRIVMERERRDESMKIKPLPVPSLPRTAAERARTASEIYRASSMGQVKTTVATPKTSDCELA